MRACTGKGTGRRGIVTGEYKAINKTSFYLRRMLHRGFSSDQVLEGSGLREEDVKAAAFRPNPRQYRKIIQNIMRLTQDPYIGIALGAEFKISDLGMLGYAALSSPTMSRAREMWNKYSVLDERILHTINDLSSGKWYSEIREIFPLGELLPFAIEEFVSQTMALGSQVTNRPYPILEMHLTYGQPDDLSAYRQRFDCPMYFNQPKNIILFDIQTLDYPVSLANEEVFELCEQQCRQILDRLEHSDLLSDEIRDDLVKNPGQFPSLEEMAARLKMGSRTLRRRLVKENLTYQQILDETRKDLAIQYLEHTSLAPKEIGFLLGYNSVSNFRRAFKSWTGKKLTDYRGAAH